MKPSLLPLFALLAFASIPTVEAQILRGAEIPVHQRLADSSTVGDVAVTDDGRFVVVWTQTEGTVERVLVRLFDAAGRPRTDPFPVANVAHGSQRSPRVAIDRAGGFVVVWQTRQQVWGRRFDADGKALARRFPLDEDTGEGQSWPEVGIAPDGRLLVAWSENDGLDPELGLHSALWGRWLAADGRPEAPPFLVSNDFWQAESARIAFNALGGVALVFQGYGGEGVFYDIFLQRYGADGSPRSALVQVNTDEDIVGAGQWEPSVALADDGRSLVAWTDNAGDLLTHPELGFEDIQGVRARFFRGNGTPAGPSFAVNTFTDGNQGQPTVALTRDGDFLLTWTSGGGHDGEGDGIFAHYLGRGGETLGREFRVNLGRKGNQSGPVLAVSRNGWGVAAWTSLPLQGSGTPGLFARRFEPQ